MFRSILIVFVLLLAPALCAAEERTATASVHAGFLYPNGVDLAGYTVEKSISDNVYYFYTFGFPSLAAAGLCYYADYEGNGLSGTIGVGIGSVLYASLVYQWENRWQAVPENRSGVHDRDCIPVPILRCRMNTGFSVTWQSLRRPDRESNKKFTTNAL